MRCLEVAVNGERFCVAGADHVPLFCASVTHGGVEDAAERDKTRLKVYGLSGDAVDDYYWGAETFALASGDIVTIRVVDGTVADSPTPFPVPPMIARLRKRQRDLDRKRAAVRASPARLDLPALDQQMRANLMRTCLWLALVLLGFAVWWFAQ
jgi:hypothetical protein